MACPINVDLDIVGSTIIRWKSVSRLKVRGKKKAASNSVSKCQLSSDLGGHQGLIGDSPGPCPQLGVEESEGPASPLLVPGANL